MYRASIHTSARLIISCAVCGNTHELRSVSVLEFHTQQTKSILNSSVPGTATCVLTYLSDVRTQHISRFNGISIVGLFVQGAGGHGETEFRNICADTSERLSCKAHWQAQQHFHRGLPHARGRRSHRDRVQINGMSADVSKHGHMSMSKLIRGTFIVGSRCERQELMRNSSSEARARTHI